MLAVTSCGSDAPTVNGQGTILYWHTQLVTLGQCSGADLVASLVPDDFKLEVLSIVGQGVHTTALTPARSGCEPSPIQIAGIDADGDGLTDLAVFDTGCGNWIAKQSADCTFEQRDWAELLPDLPAMPWVVVGPESQGALRSGIVAAWPYSVSVLVLPATGGWGSAGQITFSSSDVGQTEVSTGVQFITDPQSGADALAFQRGGYLDIVAIDATVGSLGPVTDYQQAEIAPPYLRPFLAFDQLVVIPNATCGQVGLGFGTFTPGEGITPHRLQRITFAPGGYQTTELATTDGYALAWRRSAAGVDHLATITSDGSQRVLSLSTLDECQTLTRVASVALPAQVLSSPTRDRLNNGLVFLGQEVNGLPVTFTYDGTTAIACSASSSGMSCSNLQSL